MPVLSHSRSVVQVPRLARVAAAAAIIVTTAVPNSVWAGSETPPRPPDATLQAATANLPPGWSLARGVTGRVELRLALDQPLDIRDARPEFRLGDRILGIPREDRTDRRTLSLEVGTIPAGDLSTLSAFHGSTPLDAVSKAAPAPSAVEPRSIPGLIPGQGRAPINAYDPAEPGPFTPAFKRYQLPKVRDIDMPAPLEVVAEVTIPQQVVEDDVAAAPTGPNGRPLVLLLHGRHATCYNPADPQAISIDYPCVAPFRDIPSYRGYRYLARLLASQGYYVVSISANGINAQDGGVNDAGMAARSRLVRHHLALWQQWATTGGDPFGGILRDRVDMSRVVLIGHSRGGEGVERAALDAVNEGAPYSIVGLGLIGPTAFGRQTAVGIHTAVILPYCDGDVSDLQGQSYVDNASSLLGGKSTGALSSAVLVKGANHNYYNTEWTPGQAVAPSQDDWLYSGTEDSKRCGASRPDRLSPVEQQSSGAVYLAALVQLAAANEQRAVPFLDGTWTRSSRAGRAIVLTHAVGGRRTQLVSGATVNSISAYNSMTARRCDGYNATFEAPSLCSQSERNTPHWLPLVFGSAITPPRALKLKWRDRGATATITLPAPVDLSRTASLEMRAALDPSSLPVGFRIRLTDTTGRQHTLSPVTPTLVSLLGTAGPIPKIWAQTVRVDLAAVPGAIRSNVAKISLVASTPGGIVYVLDVSGRNLGTGRPSAGRLPSIGIPDINEPEGNTTRNANWVFPITGTVTKPARVLISTTTLSGESSTKEVVIRPGQTELRVPVKVMGDSTFTPYGATIFAAISALENITTSRWIGAFTVIEDDPAPVVTFTDDDITVREGGVAEITINLSFPLAVDLYPSGSAVQTPGAQLSTLDLTRAQLADFGYPGIDIDISLWSLGVGYFGILEPGMTQITFRLAIARDRTSEGEEVVTFEFGNQSFNPLFADSKRVVIRVPANNT